jgi:hypothetical protein
MHTFNSFLMVAPLKVLEYCQISFTRRIPLLAISGSLSRVVSPASIPVASFCFCPHQSSYWPSYNQYIDDSEQTFQLSKSPRALFSRAEAARSRKEC